MKTTIEIADPLLREAKAVAASRGVTLRELVERGLRQVIMESSGAPPFRLRKASFKGRGLQAQLGDAGWERLRDMAYEGRGG